MKTIDHSGVFDWIANGRTPMPETYAPTGVPLSRLLPLQFPTYAKILHRIHGHFENVDDPLSPEEIELLNLDCATMRELAIRHRQGDSRIRWKDAAAALDVPYAKEICHAWFASRLKPNQVCWPRFVYGPSEGMLEASECLELAALLGRATGQQNCYFRLAEIPYIATDQQLLFEGRLDEVTDFFANGDFQFTPEYWWPPDHSWCVCSDYDLDFTFVGGSTDLIQWLLKSEVLECMEVDRDLRVDSLVPMPE